jgi:hypothetical protein
MKSRLGNKIIGGLESLAGAGIIAYATFHPEAKDNILSYIVGGLVIIDGTADFITGQYAYIGNRIATSLIKYIEKKNEQTKNKIAYNFLLADTGREKGYKEFDVVEAMRTDGEIEKEKQMNADWEQRKYELSNKLGEYQK